MLTKKLITVAVVAFACFYAVVFTASAVSLCHGAWHDVVSIAHGIGSFLNRLSGSKSSST